MLALVEQEKNEDRQLAKDLQGKYVDVQAVNACSSPLKLAVRYTTLRGRMRVHGWYTLFPFRQGITILKTQQKEFSFYIESNVPYDKLFLWENERILNVPLGPSYLVSTSPLFEYIDNDQFALGWQTLASPAKVRFLDVQINPPSKAGIDILSFTCPAWSPL